MNLTQTELGNKLKVGGGTISSWEMNRTEPNVNYLIKLAKIFNITLDELTQGSDAVPLYDNVSFAMLDGFNSLDENDKKLVMNIIKDLQNRNK